MSDLLDFRRSIRLSAALGKDLMETVKEADDANNTSLELKPAEIGNCSSCDIFPVNYL